MGCQHNVEPMQNRFNPLHAGPLGDDDLAMRIYTSRLLGCEPKLVLHGGGNTSVKTTVPDFFGRDCDVLMIKGSGRSLSSIGPSDFSALKLTPTQTLATLSELSDDDMAFQLQSNLMQPDAPRPSVESILHAIIPFKFVDHTHADAVVTLTNCPLGDSIMAAHFDDCWVLPYRMPGFELAKQIHEILQTRDLRQSKGIILRHHGVFTFADDAKTAYENMIQLVNRAQQLIAANLLAGKSASPNQDADVVIKDNFHSADVDLLRLCSIRKSVCQVRGQAQVAILDTGDPAAHFALLDNVDDLARRGPITPDHVIHTKRTACVFEAEAKDDPGVDVKSDADVKAGSNTALNDASKLNEAQQFAADYLDYFDRHRSDSMTMLDPAPRWGVWKNHGTLAFGDSVSDCGVVADINEHTTHCIQTAQRLGGWHPLDPKGVFDLEYWVLEQQKIARKGIRKMHQGKIALVTGAASGIGLATAQRLHDDGCVVVGLDVDPAVEERLNLESLSGRCCDLTIEADVEAEVHQIVRRFGGLDLVVLNAGVFESGESIEGLTDSWTRAIDVNLTATQRVLRHSIPFLKRGFEASAIIVGSRNFSAPGAGASAYSVSKAGVTQLARVAALELAQHNVRVNTIHPDAVFDTGIWSPAALKKSADRYGMTIEQYKSKNLLRREITSADVAAMISTVAGPVFASTTGAQIPIDGGNDRVI